MDQDVTLPSEEISLPDSGLWPRLPVLGGVVGIAALAVSFLQWGEKQFFFSYLAGFFYWLSIALGGLFFVIVHYAARSGWSVVVRRLAEHVMGTLPLFIVLFVPIIFGIHDLYHWSHAEALEHDTLLQHKSGYLNESFFLRRSAVYLLTWAALAFFFWRQSTRQDRDGDEQITRRLQKRSAPCAVAFAFTLNFAAFDWLMSLEPHWFSTIFGVYVFSGCALSIYALLILLSFQLQSAGRLKSVVTWDHFHDMGKMLFAFTVFWAYIGFSQFMLIWYANIPEETFWFDLRWHDPGWRWASIFLATCHFFVPFFWLITQPAKRSRWRLTAGALWMLLMHYVDIYWLVMPTLHHEGFQLSWLDLTCWLGVGGLFLGALGLLLRRQPLVPVRDPRLAESLSFEGA